MNNESGVRKWITDGLKNGNFTIIDIEVTGNSEKGDGYVGDITFVMVTGTNSENVQKVLHLVIKSGKENDGVREKLPVRLAFEREIFLYDKVIPAFKQIEIKNNVNISSKFIPKCYNTLLYDRQEVIILENLKTAGYGLHDRMTPLNLDHLKLTLERYGEWHALSIAHRLQRPDEHKKLFGNLECIIATFLPAMQDAFKMSEKGFYQILENSGQHELLKRLQNRIPNGLVNSMADVLNANEEHTVFIHGDCWNNNFMFKYDDIHPNKPQHVKFLDFQVCRIGSPVLDLSYHIYSTSSHEELQHFDELLQIYYRSLSQTLTRLNCNLDKLFTYEELLRQWTKYSSFGLIMAVIVLPLALSDKEDTLDITDITGDKMEEAITKATGKRNDLISSRMIAITQHFLKH